jgi:phosphate starvation-inducible PhoH-like protein
MSRKNGRHKNKHNYHYNDYLTGDPKVIELQTNTPHFTPPSKHTATPKPIQARNPSQARFMAAIKHNTLIFGLGPAGTGKSYCTAAMAAEALLAGEIDRVIFTRPAVETGKSLGFLPGKIEDKFDPYFAAFKSCLISNAGRGVVECALKNGNVVVEPLAYMRGKTFNRCFVILDEAQNCTAEEIKMFMTRIGKNSTVVINGDLSQTDLDDCSGLHDAINRVHDVRGVHVHEFSHDDIVRSGIVKDIIKKYEVSNPRAYRFCSTFA